MTKNTVSHLLLLLVCVVLAALAVILFLLSLNYWWSGDLVTAVIMTGIAIGLLAYSRSYGVFAHRASRSNKKIIIL